MLAGRLPHVPNLLDSDGLILRKPAGGIRPIAIREAWLRLAALCAVHEYKDLVPSIASLQLGFGMSGGAKSGGHALRSTLRSLHNHLLLSLGCKNAYNSISRQEIFHATQEHAPLAFLFSPGRTAARREFSSEGRHTTPPRSSPPSA
jgi:hypothetical protein